MSALPPLACHSTNRSRSHRSGRWDGGERFGLGRLDRHDIEPDDSVELPPIVPSPECDPRHDDDAVGEGPLQLIGPVDAELEQVALRHRQCGRAEPEVEPDSPAGVLAVEHVKGELVTGRSGLRAEKLSADDATPIVAGWDRLEVVGGLGSAPGLL